MKTKHAIETIGLLVVLLIEPIADAVDINKMARHQINTAKASGITLRKQKIKIIDSATNRDALNEIQEIKNKTLVVKKNIDDVMVSYYEHKRFNFTVKNDSLLLHLDMRTNEILRCEKTWTDLAFNYSSFEESMFEPDNYYWKEKVVFPDEDDCSYFYTFDDSVDFPVACWEVRHTDGSTILYDSNGSRIGSGVQAPTVEAFAMSGYDKGYPHDIWSHWRANAQGWFRKWVEKTSSIGMPKNEQVSYIVKDPNIKYFYEIAHSGGLPTRFQTNKTDVWYTADQLRADMKDRQPMELTILCSCEAMASTDEGTLSYEFRKGETENTITIGYVGMGSCPGWVDSLDWQNCMFLYMDRGFSVKKSFDIACQLYPKIADCVKFVGDEKVRVQESLDLQPREQLTRQILETSNALQPLLRLLIIRLQTNS